MSPEARRTILLEVAAGRLTPEEAAGRLEALRRAHPDTSASATDRADADPAHESAEPSAAARATGAPGARTGFAYAYDVGAGAAAGPGARGSVTGTAAATGTVTAVRIEAAAGRVQVTGDPAVAGVAVDEGDHTVHHEGSTIVVERTPPLDGDDVRGFVLDLKRGRRRRISWGRGEWRDETPLVVRVNPDLPLGIELNAGTFSVRRVHGPLDLELNAGTGRVEGFRGPLRAVVNAGSLTAAGRLDQGESKVTCDAGSVRLELDRDSSVEVVLAATLGKVSVDAPHAGIESSRGVGLGNDERRFTLGEGAGRLDVRVNLGKIHIGTV